MRWGRLEYVGLYYFNWAGKPEELNEFIGVVQEVFKAADEIDFKGLFVPNSEWNYAILYETASYDEAIEAFRNGMKKCGEKWQPRITLAKNELLYTREELGYQSQ